MATYAVCLVEKARLMGLKRRTARIIKKPVIQPAGAAAGTPNPATDDFYIQVKDPRVNIAGPNPAESMGFGLNSLQAVGGEEPQLRQIGLAINDYTLNSSDLRGGHWQVYEVGGFDHGGAVRNASADFA